MQKFTPLPLGSITMTDEYLCNALEKETAYLTSLEEGRFLAGFYENAGIRTPYVRYGGWEGLLIAGHAVGHYLSALAQAVASRGVDERVREKLRKKMRRMIEGLAACQREDGFLWAAPKTAAGYPESQFDAVERGETNIKTQAWVPWYTMHKLIAGLLDCAVCGGEPLALTVAEKLGGWAARRALGWDAQTQKAVLAVEYGGMNDCLYELYAHTGNALYARAAHVFDEEALFDLILTEGKDVLKDRHANTTIPKVIGAFKRYCYLHGQQFDGETVDASRYLRVAEAFFRMVVARHTYATGGNSEWEHFGADFILDGERTNCNCETCNVYNMLKLARLLFCETGDKAYCDYYDNAFTNSILSSQDPETGMTTYFQPMAGGFFKVFSRPYDQFWCCTGSGMENFTKAGDSAIYACGTDFYIAQYLSMRMEHDGTVLCVEAGFPLSDTAVIRVGKARAPFTLFLRVPDWAAGAPQLKKNGAACEAAVRDGRIAVAVRAGDELSLRIPVDVRLCGLPDAADTFAFAYGGAVLSADLGCEDMRVTETGVGVSIPARRIMSSERVYFPDVQDVLSHPARYLVRRGDTFELTGGDVGYRFGLHYRRYRERYAIYFKLREGEREPERVLREPIDTVQPGYGQYETDELHALREAHSVSVTADGTCRYAKAGGAFEYDMRVSLAGDNTLSVGLLRADNHKPLTIEAGGETVFEGRVLDTMSDEPFYRREFLLPAALVKAHVRYKTVNGESVPVIGVRFSGTGTEESARICEFIYMYEEKQP